MCQLFEPELHFPEINFDAYFQGSMGHKRHFVHYLYTIFFLCLEGLVQDTVCLFMHIVTDLLAHLVAMGQQLILTAPPVLTGFIPLAFLSLSQGTQIWGSSIQALNVSLSCWISSFIFFGS